MTIIDRRQTYTLQRTEESFPADIRKSAVSTSGSIFPPARPHELDEKWRRLSYSLIARRNFTEWTAEYIDLCLGDTAHDRPLAEMSRSLAAASKKASPHASTEDSSGRRRSSAPLRPSLWQFTLTATDANRFPFESPANHAAFENLVFHYCYHGTVDEPSHHPRRRRRPRRGNIVRRQSAKPLASSNSTISTRSKMPQAHDVACILAEPA